MDSDLNQILLKISEVMITLELCERELQQLKQTIQKIYDE